MEKMHELNVWHANGMLHLYARAMIVRRLVAAVQVQQLERVQLLLLGTREHDADPCARRQGEKCGGWRVVACRAAHHCVRRWACETLTD